MRTLPIALLALASALSPAAAQESFSQDPAVLTNEIEAADAMRRYGVADAPAKPTGTVRIATYNLLNLFDDQDDPALSGDHEDIDDTKPLHERLAVARAIRELDADVLCVQEVESLAALTEFRDEFLADMGYEHIASVDAGDERGIEQAVLSRKPIVHVENWPRMPLGGIHPENYGPSGKNWYAGQPIVFHRSPLRVDIDLGTAAQPEIVTLFVVHHKSGRYSAYWRDAEAAGAVELLKSLQIEHPDRPVLVLGDFNAVSTDQSVQTYVNAGFDDIFAKRSGADSFISHESGRRIDLILANAAARAQLLSDQAFVLGTAARPDGINYRDLPTFVGLASDHYPVAVDFRPHANGLRGPATP